MLLFDRWHIIELIVDLLRILLTTTCKLRLLLMWRCTVIELRVVLLLFWLLIRCVGWIVWPGRRRILLVSVHVGWLIKPHLMPLAAAEVLMLTRSPIVMTVALVVVAATAAATMVTTVVFDILDPVETTISVFLGFGLISPSSLVGEAADTAAQNHNERDHPTQDLPTVLRLMVHNDGLVVGWIVVSVIPTSVSVVVSCYRIADYRTASRANRRSSRRLRER